MAPVAHKFDLSTFEEDFTDAWFDGVVGTYLYKVLEKAGTMLIATPGSREDKAIERARATIGKGYTYKLGAGGRNPSNASPCTYRDGVLGCDCAGAVAYWWEFDRFQNVNPRMLKKTRPGLFGEFPYYGGWINTDSMLEDGFDNNDEWFVHLDAPIPGSIICYGSVGKGKDRRIGHEGLVVSAPAVFDRENPEHWKKTRVIDCRSARPAILERDAMTWFGKDRKGRPKQSQFLWPSFIVAAP